MNMKDSDLGLSYEAALHGVQSAIKFEMESRDRETGTELKHLRVGIDARAADGYWPLMACCTAKGTSGHE